MDTQNLISHSHDGALALIQGFVSGTFMYDIGIIM
jgi:hypothetical protein